ncbi:LPS export ABC transporter permease LptF [Ideonella livida]|uniref:Lipopolysaccharide export system permease protein LptF n=1 Tax=Ideonella livida TaxID=2707176 RepID=A0A7C9PIX8_9BURK|nr:LPS export ABC transporter permease LptF [Ideonella livida]NDY92170.1 LPS export ABC transporter permease LptF [Ideonella livida]
MLFHRSIRLELARVLSATLVVLLTIVLTMMLIRTLGLAARGSVGLQDVALVLVYTALSHVPTLIGLALFVAVVVGMGRMYRDSEMAVWFSSGVSLFQFLRPVYRMAWPVMLVGCGLALFGWPWFNQELAEIRQRFAQRSDLDRIAPGSFQQSADGQRVYFVDRAEGQDENGHSVFLLQRDAQAWSVTTARTGKLSLGAEDGAQSVELRAGHRHERDLADGSSTHVEFGRFTTVVNPSGPGRSPQASPKTRQAWQLLEDATPAAWGELVWRTGMVLSILLMPVLALALSATNPRRSSNWNLILALLSFVVYFNLINLSQAWVAAGRLAPAAGLLLIHGGVLVGSLALLAWRENAVSWTLRWTRSGTGPAATCTGRAGKAST